MKRFVFILVVLFCGVAFAETININWKVDNAIYSQSTCEYGGDLNVPSTPTKYGYTFQGWRSIYIPIEYVKGGSVGGFSTGIKPNQNTKFRIRFSAQNLSGQDVLINAGSGNTYRFFIYNGILMFDCFDVRRQTPIKANVVYDVLVGAKYIKNYETNEFIAGSLNTGAFNRNADMYVQWQLLEEKIYLIQIWDDDILIRDFIPVLDMNNTPCMFDRIEKKFYYSSGNLVAGPIIAN